MTEDTYTDPSEEQVEAIIGNTRLMREMISELSGEDSAPGRPGDCVLSFFDVAATFAAEQRGPADYA